MTAPTPTTALQDALRLWLTSPDHPDAIAPSATDLDGLLWARRYEAGTYDEDDDAVRARAEAEIEAILAPTR